MTARLTIHALGQLTITLDGQPLTSLSSRTAEALLVYLVCEKRPLSRQFLADFLWDERAPERASANLRTLLTMMRKSLGDFLHITRQSVAFNFDSSYWLDSLVLEEQLTALSPLLQQGHVLDKETLARLEAAVSLYQGDFLEGFYLTESRGFEEWMLLTHERLRRLVKTALEKLVAYTLANGLYEQGIGYARQLVALDPLAEAGHRQLMWLLARSGQRNAALQQYQSCHILLAEELAVAPAPATAAVYEKIRSLALPPPCDLPPATGPFVGRAEELTAVTHQLAQVDCRLLTLVGPGGVGKTRLALEAARHLHQQRPGRWLDGTIFIPLDPVETAVYLPQAIAQKVGLTFRGAVDPAQQLLNFLAGRELLLLLDNFEHLLNEPEHSLALIAQILTQAPHVTLLITSRQRLNLREEWLFDVPGLTYPTVGGDVQSIIADLDQQPDQVMRYSGLHFFVQHARRGHRSFAPTPADWRAIIRLCQLLEGLPLGLELAAAGVRQTSCAEIVRLLTERPAELASQVYNVPDRHRSLTAVFHHSWSLLAEAEQACLARLSIFRGSFNETAAAAVAQATPLILLRLLDRSLLRWASEAGWYEMHPLLRQLAAVQLSGAEKSAVAAAHAHYFGHWLADHEAQLHSDAEQTWLAHLRLYQPDLRAAWRWATAQAPPATDLLAAMLGSLTHLYDVQALYREGIRLLQTAVLPTPGADPILSGRLLSWIGRFQYHLGEYASARTSLDTAAELLRASQQTDHLALALTFRGEAARLENDLGLARAYQKESIRLAQSEPILALALLHLGKVDIAEGAYEAAQQVCQQGLTLAQQYGSPRQIAIFEDNLGTVLLEQTHYEAAERKFMAAYELRYALNDQWGIAASLNNLGVLALITGDYEEAVDKYRLAETVFEQIGHAWGAAQALTNLGRAFVYQQAFGHKNNGGPDRPFERATQTLRRALQVWQQVDSELEQGDCWLYLGQLALYQEAYETARHHLETSMAILTRLEDERQLPVVWRELGVALTRLGLLPEAKTYLRLSLEAAQAQSLTLDVLYALSGWGLWLGVQQETGLAQSLLQLAMSHPATWYHERAEAQRWLTELTRTETAVTGSPSSLTLETAVVRIRQEYF